MVIAYIGDLNDPEFKWEKGNWDGNIPSQLGPEFPFGSYVSSLIIDKILKGELDGKQVDWGAYVARVDKAQLIKFTDEFYGDVDLYRSIKYIKELKEFIICLM